MRLATITDGRICVYEIDHAAVSLLGVTNASAETLPSVWRMISSRHLWGTEPRWRHFLRAEVVTRSARAASSTKVHSESVMSESFRDNMSPCKGTDWAETTCPRLFNLYFMGNDLDNISAIAAGYQQRTQQARLESGYTQEEIAELLGIKKDRYKKWENRSGSTMPVEYHERFCFVTSTRRDWFMTGKGTRAEKPRIARPRPKKLKFPVAG